MHPNFELPGKEQFQLSTGLPDGYQGLVLRGGDALTAQHPLFGSMIFQELETALCRIRFNIFDFLKPVTITGNQPAAKLVSLLAFKNSTNYSISGLGDLQLKQGQFALLHTNETKIEARFMGNGSCQNLEISWPEYLLEKALPYFNELAAIFSVEKDNNTFYVGEGGNRAGGRAFSLARDIITSPEPGKISSLMRQYRIPQYMFMLLLEAMAKKTGRYRLSRAEWERVVEVAMKLEAIPVKKYTGPALAESAGMNLSKLQSAFREKYGQGMFEYQLAARMEEGMRLLKETNMNIKTVTTKVGYRLSTSFTTRFREYFGYPPGDVARNNKE